LFLNFISVLNAYSISLFRTTFPGLLNDVLVRLLSIVLFTIYFIKIIDRDQFVSLFTMIYGLQLVILIIYIFIIDKPGLKIDRAFLKDQQPVQMLKYGLMLSFAALSSLGLKSLDVIILGKFVPLAMVGVYSICAFIPTVIEAPLGALEKIGLAKISEAWSKNNLEEIKEIYYKSSKYLFLAGGLLYLCVNLNIDALFELIPKGEFRLGRTVVWLISTGTLINMAAGINDSIIYTSSKYIYGTYMLIILFFLAVINNLIFIPRFGIEGAALATALSAVIFNTMKFLFIWRNFHLQPFTSASVRIVCVVVITGVVVALVPFNIHPLADIILRSGLILIIYAGLVKLFRIAPELLQKVFSRK
jgi:O-antigen/teichoic acid export membrane protein